MAAPVDRQQLSSVLGKRVLASVVEEAQATLFAAVGAGDVVKVHNNLAVLRAFADDGGESLDLEFRDSRGLTVLMCAAHEGDTDVVKELILAGAKLNTQSNGTKGGATALMIAVEQGHTETVQYMLSRGTCNVDCKMNGDGFTALHLLASSDVRDREGLAIAKLLVRAGARSNAKNHSGDTPIDIALSGGKAALAIAILAGEVHFLRLLPVL